MNKERMLELADFLSNLDQSRFDLRAFFAERFYDSNDFIIRHEQDEKDEPMQCAINAYTFFKYEEENSCKTTACIAGWAIAKFKNLVPNYSGFCNAKEIVGSSELDIASGILGLEKHEAWQLFYADSRSLWSRYSKYFHLEVCECEDEVFGVEYWSEIHPKHAAEMLRMLANEEISFLTKEEFNGGCI